MDNSKTKTINDEKEASPKGGAALGVGADAKDESETRKPITIGAKEFKWLRKNKYDEIREKFSTTFVLQHKKHRGKVAEIRAASPLHACRLIHWKPNQTILLDTREDAHDAYDIDNIQSSDVPSASLASSVL